MNDEGYYSWPFMSVHHWGEQPVGDWKINIYFSSESGYVTLSNLAVVLYGTNQVPEAVLRIPEQCDSECVRSRGCAAPGDQYCDVCRNQRMLSSLHCVQHCPGEDFKQENHSRFWWKSNSCSVGGYCLDCSRRLLGLSVPIISLIALSGFVLLIASAVLLFILWSKCCKSNNDYVPI